MKSKTFEDLKVWQDSREFVKSIYELTSSNNFAKDYGLKDQIQRAAVSIMNNIAEGFERNNNKVFVVFLKYSKGSAGEIRSMLYIALDLKYISQSTFDEYYSNVIKIITQISNFIKYLKIILVRNSLFKN
ncbi:MAG: four helix bundle protein [Ignavibacteriota bacterium]|nr:MAG: four helix bundle protein [Chlorobiota bacterium]MBE7475568.1 four helix bundle protein [Ignavibacteriales bacterium]MBL1123122.1 four helix bundle protein [Ignavibacteriota bacterium]MCC7092909.1 four helix bundle protein [Ignavibacteriaceae bacterium]MCE7855665.1 four helix bundle protein [Ignavibacteria bacterium CHB3]MEB2297264.1 four helix bundle protein [Ignavibacteria bacterium]